MPKIGGFANVPATEHFNFVYGSFKLSEWSIPYLTTTMSLSEVAKSLRLASELPASETIEWKIEELFQRSIDWKRVSTQIVPYLENEKVPQFFNSITIALVPLSNDPEVSTFSSNKVDWNPPGLDHEDRFENGGSVTNIGPLSIGWWDAPPGALGTIGVTRWNPEQVFSVAIDGQHRLAAIKEAVGDGVLNPNSKWNDTRVSVVLLVFDELLGYSAPPNQTPIQVMRRLFIDMNKNAQKVSRARQILLDDYEPHAACVRKIIGEGLKPDLVELDRTPPSFPLSLVDWSSELAKFDTGPFITTVLLVDWIVVKVLASRADIDSMAYGSLQKQIRTFEERLVVDLSSARKRLEQCKSFDKAFTYSDDDLALIGKSFGQVWSRPIVHILTNYSPYAQLIERRKSNASLSLDFQNWHELYNKVGAKKKQENEEPENRDEENYKRFLHRLKHRTDNPVALDTFLGMLSEVENFKEGRLSFKVVFQKALIEAFVEFAKISKDELAEFHDFHGAELPSEIFELEVELDEDDLDENGEEEDYIPGQLLNVDNGPSGKDEHGKFLSDLAILFVNALNRVWENSTIFDDLDGQVKSSKCSTRFWAGTLRKPETGEADHTQGASTRAKDLILLVVLMVMYDDLDDPRAVSQFSSFWDRVGPSSLEPLPKLLDRARGLAKRYCRDNESSAAYRIISGADEEFEETLAESLLRSRLEALWNSTGL